MHAGKLGITVVALTLGMAGVAGAEPPAVGSVVVPLVGAGGRPAFCGANHTGGRARPQDDGGYRVDGLAPGRHVVHLELNDERIDVLVMVAAGEDVVVPPVVVRGTCRDVSLRAPLIDVVPHAELPGWTLRIGRRYQARSGTKAAVFERDRGLMRIGATRRAVKRDELRAQTRGL